MKILLLDHKQVTHYNLPEKVSGEYIFNYINDKTKLGHTLHFVSENEKWFIKSNDSISILNQNEIIEEAQLANYNFYILQIFDSNQFLWMYCCPSIDEYKDNYIINTSEILIGNDTSCDIYFKSSAISAQYIKIIKKDEDWIITLLDNKGILYLNDSRVKEAKLNIGDVLFTYGLKFVWMGHFLQINCPRSYIALNPGKFPPYVINEDTISDQEKIKTISMDKVPEIYKEEDYFFHIPRLKEKIEKEKVIIDPPPEYQEFESLPLLISLGSGLTMISSSFSMVYTMIIGFSNGTKTLVTAVPTMVMCVALIIGSLIMPRVTTAYQKKKSERNEKMRQVKYTEYLHKKNQEITKILNKQSNILKSIYLTPDECETTIKNRNIHLWDREIKDGDFLTIRLGIGDKQAELEITSPEERFSVYYDNLKQMVYDLAQNNNVLTNVPITYSLIEHKISSMISINSITDNYNQYINYIILQLITYHSPEDLKLVFFLRDGNHSKWNYAKFLPHVFNEDKSIRFFATNTDELKNISNFLIEQLKDRKEKTQVKEDDSSIQTFDETEKYKKYSPYYLIITDDYMFSRNGEIVDEILNDSNNYGFSFLLFENSLRRLPSECSTLIQIFDNNGALIEKELNDQTRFVIDSNKKIDMSDVSGKLLNIPVLTKEALASLPTTLTFLEMFNVSKISQLNILNRWNHSDPTVSLQTQIGVHKNGDPFYLDLHEKFQGPHGLIAGSTGSGKSEFIISFILSMALNYHPYDVQFVLIDYKGGGLAGAFENRKNKIRIPHLAGTITNLDTNEMHRSLVSINSELKRREHIFNEARSVTGESTIDIYKYQKYYKEGILKEPISHLFIISDEFAELKAQQPEFMDELISTSRIGRSLGVHLILATQKPSGVVNDQIWSNSRFKVCLKVQSKSDSMEMLKRPEAASIKEAGRFYLQVGYDEYFEIGQSGWSGATYIPTDHLVKKYDDSVNFINNVGEIIKSVNNFSKVTKSQNYGDQLTNIVKELVNIADEEHLYARKLWLDPIPEKIYLDELKEKYDFKKEEFHVNPIIGEYDAPVEQSQGLLTLDFNNGSTLIYGKNGSGKEDLLATIIYSSITNYSPNEINFYIIDLGAETLKMFNRAPHVGEICTLDDNQKIVDLLVMIDDELDRRKELFSEYAGNYNEYCKSSGQKLPIITVIINNFEVFTENFRKLTESMFIFFRESSKYGIDFIVTTSVTNSIRQKVAENFNNKICLEMGNVYDYITYLNAPKGLIPAHFKGRGIVSLNNKCYEFQTASITREDNLNEYLKLKQNELKDIYDNVKIKSVPTLPNVVNVKDIIVNVKNLENLPIGYSVYDKEWIGYNFTVNQFTQVISNNISQCLPFFKALLTELKLFNNLEIHVIDAYHLFTQNISRIDINSDNFNLVVNNMKKSISENLIKKQYCLYLFLGINKFINLLDSDAKMEFQNILMSISTYNNTYIIIADNANDIRQVQLDDWYIKNINKKYGIWLGEGISVQNIISLSNLTNEDRMANIPYLAFAVSNEKYNLIRYMVEGENNEE